MFLFQVFISVLAMLTYNVMCRIGFRIELDVFENFIPLNTSWFRLLKMCIVLQDFF